MKDNNYDSIEEDAIRRDSTCNTLYYDPTRRLIVDFHHGVADVQAKKLVMTNNLTERYQEDPMHTPRTTRLSGKLSFGVEEHAATPVPEYAGRLKQESVSRLFDEILKLLFSGHACDCLQQFNRLGIGGDIHPLLTATKSADKPENQIIPLTPKSIDGRLRIDKSISTGSVLAAVLWSQFNRYWQHGISQGQRPSPVLTDAINKFHDDTEKGRDAPQRFAATMHKIWQFQPQLDNTRGARPYHLLT